MAVLALARPFLYVTNRSFATRLLHTVLRGVSRDRLDLLGEEFFEYFLKPRLKPEGESKLRALIAGGGDVVLVSQGLDHVMRPLAQYLGAKAIISNRLDFRDGICTGRLLDPVIRPRGLFARFTGGQPDGTLTHEALVRVLGFEKHPEVIDQSIRPAERPAVNVPVPTVQFRTGADGVAAFGARSDARKECAADRRDGFHRESLAGELADGLAGNRPRVFAGAA